MRILMMGTGPFAVPTFRALHESSHELIGLFTRPVPTSNRRRRSSPPPNPMRDAAEAWQIPVEAPDSINAPATVGRLAELEADLFVVCDYGQILSRDALATSRLGGINLHGSLLPKYRGAAPVNWAIYHGEPTTGVTVIHMTPRLDAGPNLVQVETPIGGTEDAVTLEGRLAEMGVRAVLDSLTMLSEWDGNTVLGNIQDDRRATKAPRLKKHDGWVDWNASAEQVANQVRAFKPWPGTFTEWQRSQGNLRILLEDVCVADERPAPAPPGTVADADDQAISVACGSGVLQIQRLQPAGKRVQSAAEFQRGYPLHPGDQFGGQPDHGNKN